MTRDIPKTGEIWRHFKVIGNIHDNKELLKGARMMTNDEMESTIKSLSDILSEERLPHILAFSDKDRQNANFDFAGDLTDFIALIAASISHFSSRYGIKKEVLLKAVAAGCCYFERQS